MNDMIAEELGYQKHFDFTQYSHDNNVNVIPEQDFKRLVADTFRCIADNLRNTYGPYASSVLISDQSETYATKDGYNVFNAIGFSHTYKNMVYLAIKKIIDRVNHNVGDGTTSCILLAEKLFNELNHALKTVDDKRNIMDVLSNIERDLLNELVIAQDRTEGMIKPLTKESLEGLVRVASNYDSELTHMIMDALSPTYDEDGNVTTIRNIIVDSALVDDSDTLTYDVDFLPGDYRIRVEMDQTFALTFMEPRPVRVALYDHQFGADDWNFFMQNYDKVTETVIIAREFSRSFLDHEFYKYCRDLAVVKRPCPIIFVKIKGEYVRDEIKDLGAVLGFEPIGLYAKAVDHTTLPVKNIQVFKGNCMCFDMPNPPIDYIETVKADAKADLSKSLTKPQWYRDRIRALSNTAKDTLIVVNATSSLERKMVADKIDDCISIVNSAMTYGVIPNLFAYGHYRIGDFHPTEHKDLSESAQNAIMRSIEGLLRDIWESKHGADYESKCNTIIKTMYADDDTYESFDIIKERFVPIDKIPTSAQYDLEVIAAAISIVKYLLTGRALIFDAFIMKKVDDTGSYSRN